MQILPYRKFPSPLQNSSLLCIFILKGAEKFSNERVDERKNNNNNICRIKVNFERALKI